MPVYSYRCQSCERRSDKYNPVDLRHAHAPYCHGKMELEIQAAMVQPDIAPYRAVAGDRAGQMITSRRAHKEFLKRNRFTEVGNEPIRPIKNDFRPRKGEIAQELKKVIPQVLRRS